MLCDEQPSVGVYRKAFAVANAAGIAFRGRERLIGFARVVAPGAAAGLLLRAGLTPQRVRDTILLLAGVSSRSHIDEQIAFRIDDEGAHGMIPRDGSQRNDLALARGTMVRRQKCA